jgi:predicted O-methyltransferase YrrM
VKVFLFIKYLEYKIFSSHSRGHGIHSPFVFNLVTKVFRNKTDAGVVFTIEQIRRNMISDKRLISVTDFGSGSVKMRSNLRKVSDIARDSSVPRKYGTLLNRLSCTFGRSHIIELGTSLGISTLYLASGSEETVVHTIEGCPETSRIAEENFKNAGAGNIKAYCGSFDVVLPEIEKENFTPGLVFIDGDHTKEAVLRYFVKVAEMSDNKTVIVFDDIYDSKGMSEAWDEIKKNKKVSVTVDIFRMGLVFFREGLSRSDYIIRY